MILHAGLVAAWDLGGWRGALIEGPSGAGKSDLALRALEAGFRLAADDRVVVWACEGRLFGRAPQTLAGRMEVRGLGVAALPALPFCEIRLLVRCGAAERLPEPETRDIQGVAIPVVALAPLESSAPAKLRYALQHLGADAEPAYQARLAAPAPRPGGDSR